jgi:hypothetical protein
MPRRTRPRFRPIRIARAVSTARQPKPEKVVSFITSLIQTQIGTDEDPSPLLESLVKDLGADKDDVELAQDITLLGLEVMKVIAKAVEDGNPPQAIWGITGVISAAIPELEADIKKLTD